MASLWWWCGGMMEAAVCVAYQRMTEKPSGDGMEGGSKINKSNDLNITLNYNYYKYFPLSKLLEPYYFSQK
jgi:hypothetical protein